MVPSAPVRWGGGREGRRKEVRAGGQGRLCQVQFSFLQAAFRSLRTQSPKDLADMLPPFLQKLSLAPQPILVVVSSLCIF